MIRVRAVQFATMVWFVFGTSFVLADDGSENRQDQSDQQAIELAELPTPSTSIESLIDRGRVTFHYGPMDDPRMLGDQKSMAAETHYRIEFRFNTRLRWSVRGQQIFVRLQRLDLQWQPVHRVWFRQPPDAETFWSNRLVRHELDHVWISSDPALEKLYRDRAKAMEPFEGEIQPSEQPRAAAQRIANTALKELFEEVSSLARIRYQELDRQTRHGLDAVPEDSPLREFLGRPDSE